MKDLAVTFAVILLSVFAFAMIAPEEVGTTVGKVIYHFNQAMETGK